MLIGDYRSFFTLYPAKLFTKWPASHEKGNSDIPHSVDQDQPLYDVENTYT